jgi:recombination protein RecA
MPRKKAAGGGKKRTSSGKKRPNVLAMARKAGAIALKKPEEDWRVVLDPDLLKAPLPHLPSGSLIIDYLIGGEPNKNGIQPCPGLPRGRVVQVWGHESAGKTTLALTAAAAVCATGGTVLYVDWENDIVPDYAEALGVPISDDTRFELVQPETLEDGLKLAVIYATAGVDLIIFDSVGAAVPASVFNRGAEDVGEQAKVGELQQKWSQELPSLKGKIAKKGAIVMGISQIRAKINTGPAHGGPTTQPQGGNAWKFYSSVRIELRRIKQEKQKRFDSLTHREDERIIGGVIRAKMIKCKLSKSQGREAVFYIRWGEGIDDVRSVMEIAVAHGIVKRAGAWYSMEGPGGGVRVQGKEPFLAHLHENKADFNHLYDQVLPMVTASTIAEENLEDLSDVESILAEAAEEYEEGDDKSETLLEVVE